MIRKWITKIVNEQITNAMKEDEEMPRRVARQMNIGQVAEWMEASDIAEHFDAYDIAREIDVYDVAQNVDTDDVAYNIDSGDVAECISAGDVAIHIDMDALSRYILDDIEVDYEKLAKAVIKHQKENTGEEE